MAAARSRLRRWHVWLGWIVGIPIFLWVLSGVVMVARPIEEVRGSHLLRDQEPLRLSQAPVPPAIEGVPLSSLRLEPRAAGARWIVRLPDGTARQADVATGTLLPRVTAADAVNEVLARYSGSAEVDSVSRTDADDPPLDLRRPIETWQVRMNDGTNFYVDAGSGDIVATRTRWWRVFDLMWGIHIMDLKTREDTHNPLVIGFGIAALVMSLLALALLPMTVRRRRSAQRDRR